MFKYNLKIGPVVIGLEFETDDWVPQFSHYFKRKNSSQPATIHLKIKFIEEGDFSQVPNSLFLTKKPEGKGFSCYDGLVTGFYDSETKKGEISFNKLLLQSNYPRVLEQMFYQAFNSAAPDNCFLVHSSGVIKNGEAYLFVGPSESGKSTVASLSQKFNVINDEITLFTLNDNGPMLYDTPFNGFYRDKVEGSAPLKGIYLLNKGSEHRITPVQGAKPIKIIAGELIPDIGINEFLNSKTYVNLLDRAAIMSKSVPVYQMDFLKDDGFWDVIS